MVNELTAYDSVTEIAADYFGPAAPRYVSRIIVNHLGKSPNQLRHKDIPELVNWIKLTVALVTDDTSLVEEFATRLRTLSRKYS
jgi:hypothetical protein